MYTIAVDGAEQLGNAVKPQNAKTNDPLQTLEADGGLIAFGEDDCVVPRSLGKPSVDGDEAIVPNVAF